MKDFIYNIPVDTSQSNITRKKNLISEVLTLTCHFKNTRTSDEFMQVQLLTHLCSRGCSLGCSFATCYMGVELEKYFLKVSLWKLFSLVQLYSIMFFSSGNLGLVTFWIMYLARDSACTQIWELPLWDQGYTKYGSKDNDDNLKLKKFYLRSNLTLN